MLIAAWVLAREGRDHPVASPFAVADGWRSGGPPAPVVVELTVDGEAQVLSVGTGDVGGHPVQPVAHESGVHRLEIDGLVHEAAVLVTAHDVQVSHLGHTFVFGRPDAFGPGRKAAVGDGGVTAPMPGTVLQVAVEEGQTVEEGAVLGIMEAMKMELTLTAPFSGTVTNVSAVAGAQVPLGAELFLVERVGEDA